ncbi:MAG TPA: tetratricopeptide repeat protein [Terriglobales bacterium]|nr:tetratricopeptide repeat protein [Terriglobales bacterium]
MPSWPRRFSLCAFTLLLCSLLSAAGDLASAKRAYEEEDYATAFKQLTPLAEQGNGDAQLILGKMYFMGRGVLKDQDQAMKWLKAAGTQGNADAQFFLGSIYMLPHKDIAEGVKWLRLSAEQGNQDAQLLLGKAYMEGELPRDPVQADMWLRLASKDNLPFYEAQLAAAEKQMSPDQIAKGKALAAVWKPKTTPATTKNKSTQEQKN